MGKRRKQEMLSAETRHGVAIVFLYALAVVLGLALLGSAGPLGTVLDGAMASLFGKMRWVVPLTVGLMATQLLLPDVRFLRPSHIPSGLLLLVSVTGLLQRAVTDVPTAALRDAGGATGYAAWSIFASIFGDVAALVLLIAMLLAGLIILFGVSLGDLGMRAWAVLTQAFAQTERTSVKQAPLAPVKPKVLLGGEEMELTDEKEEMLGEEEEEAIAEEAEEEEAAEEPVEKARTVHLPVQEATWAAESGDKAEPLVRPRERRSISIPLDLMDGATEKPRSGDIEANIDIIHRTLHNFGIEVEMGEVHVGPTVTQFTFKPADGVKLTKITGLANDLALALAAHPLRIEAPIPGKSLVGIEVPNKATATVRLREIIGSKTFEQNKSPLSFALGKDVSGKPWVIDIDKMPHLLVAGATGSGKSVCLNTLLLSLMYKTGPDDLKFILVDPKRVEFNLYNGIPYLITPVITDVSKTVNALKWAVLEMERRYEKLSAFGARDIKSYNERAEDGLPYLVIVIDELADLMMTASQDVEASIVRLAQMARAVGIHLILATQRPSVNVITGTIKANIPGRIAFAVASAVDSRTILDSQGAEKLLGRGDMLLSTSDMGKPKRVQGAFVGDEEIRRVVQFLKNTCEAPNFDPSVTERSAGGGTVFRGAVDGGGDGDDDPLAEEATKVILQAGKASASLLQRRLKVGYARAARILDVLEQKGIIGPADGAKPRDILIGGTSPAGADAGAPDESPDTMNT